jgi:flagellar basal-body rod protein FlgB
MYFRFHLFKKDLPLRNRALDAYATRERTTAKNIANINSPHYRPEYVKFEEYFHDSGQVAIKGDTNTNKHIPMGKTSDEDVTGDVNPAAVPEPEIYFSGETHVNIDKEMSLMAQNQIRFKFTSGQTNNFFTGLSTSITGNTFRS